MMLSTFFAIATTAALGSAPARPPQEARKAQDSGQSVNGGPPQKVDTGERTRAREGQEHWTDGMNTTHTPESKDRDEYGAPKVHAPQGHGTNNSGSLPAKALKPRRETKAESGDHGR